MRHFFLLLLTTLSFQVTGQNSSLKDFLSYSFPSNLVANDDQGIIAWVENKEGVRNIFYAKEPDYKPIQLTPYTEDDGQGLGQIRFTKDAQSLIYVRGGSPNRSGEYPNPTSNPEGYSREIYVIDFETGFPRKVADGSSPILAGDQLLYLSAGQIYNKALAGEEEASVLFSVRGGIGSLRLSPDGTKLAFVNGRGDHSFIGIFDLSKGSLSFISPGLESDREPVWSTDGSKIAFIRMNQSSPLLFTPRREALPFSIWVGDVASGKAEKIWEADEGVGSVFRTVSASNQLFWMSDNSIVFPWEKNGWTQLYTVSADGGEARSLMEGQFEVQFVSQSPDRSKIIYSSNQSNINTQNIWEVSSSGKPRLVTQMDGVQWSPVQDGAGNLHYLSSTGTRPADVWSFINSNHTEVTNEDSYQSNGLVEPKAVTYTSTDGMTIHGQLFLPEGHKKSDKRPAVIFMHGGSRRQMLLGFHHRGYYHYAYAMNQYMVSKGYVVLSINYRSGIGYGMEFREALNYGAGGASEFNDVMGAGLYLKNYPGVDSERIGLWGGSYGGYLTALGLARASDLFAAGVDIHGVTDWNVVIQGFIPSYNKLENPEFAQLAYDSSPIAFMDGWKSPVLLIHGDDDRNVPFSESVDKARELRKRGVYFEQLVFPDEVHGFLLHKNWYDAYDATADFFDRKMK